MSDKIHLSNSDINLVKELFSGDIKWVTSAYGGKRFGFVISDDFCEKNIHLFNGIYYPNLIVDIANFICRYNPIQQHIINKHILQQGHITLIKKTYFEIYEIEGETVLGLCYKRLFGNSNPLYDIYRAFNIQLTDIASEYFNNDHLSQHDYLLDETIEIIKTYLIENPIDDDLEGFMVKFAYILSPAYIRKKKINSIFNSDNM